jgi:hypothetical protein
MGFYEELVARTNKAKKPQYVEAALELDKLKEKLTELMFESADKSKEKIIYDLSSSSYPKLFEKYTATDAHGAYLATLIFADLKGIFGSEFRYSINYKQGTCYVVEIFWGSLKDNSAKEFNNFKRDWEGN